jgi:hypothetical protein
MIKKQEDYYTTIPLRIKRKHKAVLKEIGQLILVTLVMLGIPVFLIYATKYLICVYDKKEACRVIMPLFKEEKK